MLHVKTPKLDSKLESFACYNAGLFGNHLKHWKNYDDFCLTAPIEGKYGLRYKDPRGGGGFFRTDMTWNETLLQYLKWTLNDKADPHLFHFGESLPVDRLVLQGEIMRSVYGLDFTYTRERGQPNRPSLWKERRRALGLEAKILVETLLWPKSYDNLMELLEIWPDGVVEFSAVDYECGVIPGHNAIFWEVREKY